MTVPLQNSNLIEELRKQLPPLSPRERLLIATVLEIANQKAEASGPVLAHDLAPVPYVPILTPRENEVLRLVAEGNTAKEIGKSLNISYRTAELHRSRILSKLGVSNTAQLVRQIWEIAAGDQRAAQVESGPHFFR